MTYSDEEIRSRLQLAEDSGWEFKAVQFSGNRPRSPGLDDLADEIAAFANAGGGVLLCGVTDDGDVPGMTGSRSPSWTHSWSRSAPTPSSRRFGYAPSTGNSMGGCSSWSKYRSVTLSMTAPGGATFAWAARND